MFAGLDSKTHRSPSRSFENTVDWPEPAGKSDPGCPSGSPCGRAKADSLHHRRQFWPLSRLALGKPAAGFECLCLKNPPVPRVCTILRAGEQTLHRKGGQVEITERGSGRSRESCLIYFSLNSVALQDTPCLFTFTSRSRFLSDGISQLPGGIEFHPFDAPASTIFRIFHTAIHKSERSADLILMPSSLACARRRSINCLTAGC